MSIISAGTTTTTALVNTGDTTGNLVLQVNGTTTSVTLNTTGAVVLRDGNTSANGIGITFPATQSASSNANTLDDYEEGTWTPSSPTSGYVLSEAVGVYTKVGRLVTVQFSVMFSSVAGTNSSVVFTGLPFAAAALATATCQAGVCRENSATGAIYVISVQANATTSIEINSMDGVGTGQQRTLRINEKYCGTLSYIVG
jgi:hypothetical protein